MLSPKLNFLNPPALRRSPSLLPDTPQIFAGQPHTHTCRLRLHKCGVPWPLRSLSFLAINFCTYPSSVRPGPVLHVHALACLMFPGLGTPSVTLPVLVLGFICRVRGWPGSSDTLGGVWSAATPHPVPSSVFQALP